MTLDSKTFPSIIGNTANNFKGPFWKALSMLLDNPAVLAASTRSKAPESMDCRQSVLYLSLTTFPSSLVVRTEPPNWVQSLSSQTKKLYIKRIRLFLYFVHL